jgi:hypothetical protein
MLFVKFAVKQKGDFYFACVTTAVLLPGKKNAFLDFSHFLFRPKELLRTEF